MMDLMGSMLSELSLYDESHHIISLRRQTAGYLSAVALVCLRRENAVECTRLYLCVGMIQDLEHLCTRTKPFHRYFLLATQSSWRETGPLVPA